MKTLRDRIARFERRCITVALRKHGTILGAARALRHHQADAVRAHRSLRHPNATKEERAVMTWQTVALFTCVGFVIPAAVIVASWLSRRRAPASRVSAVWREVQNERRAEEVLRMAGAMTIDEYDRRAAERKAADQMAEEGSGPYGDQFSPEEVARIMAKAAEPYVFEVQMGKPTPRVELLVSRQTYVEIEQLLRALGWGQALRPDGVIDMNGVGLVSCTETRAPQVFADALSESLQSHRRMGVVRARQFGTREALEAVRKARGGDAPQPVQRGFA